MARKIAVFSFGRLNPPTIGHGKLADVVAKAAAKLGATPRMYLSHTQDAKKNPLSYDMKVKYAQAAFGNIVVSSTANTIIKVLQELAGDGFTDIVYVAGSDRVNEFEELLNKYNGKEYQFDSIKVLSAGERDPDADGVEGMSASKMREAAAANDLKSFTSGLPDKLKPAAANVMKAVRLGMKLTEGLEDHRGIKLKLSKDSDGVAVKALSNDGSTELGNAEFFFDDEGRLDPQTLWVNERYHGQGIAKAMYDFLKNQGYTIIRSWDQTDAGKGFWDKHQGPDSKIWEQGVAEGKVTLYTDPDYYGADVDDTGFEELPTVDIPLKGLVGFEPDSKMKDAKSAKNMAKMVDLIKSGKGKELPPILVRKHGDGYQVLDGHHRFHAYKAAGAKAIPGRIVPDKYIEIVESKKHGLSEDDWTDLADKFRRWLVTAITDGGETKHKVRAGSKEMAKVKFEKLFPRAKIVGVTQESLEEGTRPMNVELPGGALYVSDHFLDQAQKRGISHKKIADMVKSAIKDHGDEIAALEPSNFVIRSKDGTGIGIAKVQQPDDTFKYIMLTTHPQMRVGQQQPVMMVESDDLNIKIHHELNPAIWRDGHMRPEVRTKLLAIAEDFKSSLGVDVEVQDITVSGSNAAYSYTAKSDIDLHLVVDIPKADGDTLYRELFDAKKYKYNAEHDYKIRGYDVELYVQDANQPHVSLGIFSVKDDAWLKSPRHVTRVDSQGARYKYDQLKGLIDRALRLDDVALAHKLKETIRKYRKVGLEAHGEFGAENLAFKALRANGYLDKLNSGINGMRDAELSIESQQLTELVMSPSSLKAFMSSPVAQGMTVGFEAEMVVPNMEYEEDDYGGEPDWDADEGVETSSVGAMTDDLIRFFRDTETSTSVRRAVERATEDLWEFIQNQFDEWLPDNEHHLIEKYQDNTKLTAEEIEKSIEDRDETYDQMVEYLKEDFDNDWNDLDQWLESQDLTTMSDWSREYGFDWPHVTGGEGEEITQDSMEELAREIKSAVGARVNIGYSYKSVTREMGVWALEPDPSIDADKGNNEAGLELVSPPMPLAQGMAALDKFFDWASSYGVESNRSTGFHMGVSIPDQTMDNIDHLKLILFLGDQHVLAKFGRSANSYTKSIIEKMRERTKQVDLTSIMDAMRNGMGTLATKLVGNVLVPKGDRYVSVNIKDNYIEFRSAGGDYLSNKDKIRDTMLRYVRVMAVAADPEAEKQEYAKKLYKLLTSMGSEMQDNTIKAFSLYSAGAITRTQLIDMLKQAQHTRKAKKEPPQAQEPTSGYGRGPDWWKLIDSDGEVVSNFQAPNRAAAEAQQAQIERRAGERFVLMPAEGNTVYLLSPGQSTQRYEIYDRATGQSIEHFELPFSDPAAADDRAIARAHEYRRTQNNPNITARRVANESINESKGSMTGAEMVEYYNACHHNHMRNERMDEFVRSHDWQLGECDPDQIPDADEYRDDFFNRSMKLDMDQVKSYMEALAKGETLDPIIMGPEKSIIDGNHRGQAARAMNVTIKAYKPVGLANESISKRHMDLMLGGHLVD